MAAHGSPPQKIGGHKEAIAWDGYIREAIAVLLTHCARRDCVASQCVFRDHEDKMGQFFTHCEDEGGERGGEKRRKGKKKKKEGGRLRSDGPRSTAF